MSSDEQVLDDEGRRTARLVDFFILSFTIGWFGIVGNGINMIVFCRQGFSTTVNIAFFGLAISDFFFSFFLEWYCICLNPDYIFSSYQWDQTDVAYLSASWPHICSCRITSYITIYITTERYLSIAFPLKVKQIVTKKITTFILIVFFVVNICSLIPEYVSMQLGWRKKSKSQQNSLWSGCKQYTQSVLYLYVLHSLLGMTSFIGVIIATVALVTKLKQSSQWRKEAKSQSDPHSLKEKKLVKMIVAVACILIICNIPAAILSIATYIVDKDISIVGKQLNVAEAMWSIAYVFQTTNSSVNIILYYIMSSKYKKTFHELLSCCRMKQA
jgi:hypothetical protein